MLFLFVSLRSTLKKYSVLFSFTKLTININLFSLGLLRIFKISFSLFIENIGVSPESLPTLIISPIVLISCLSSSLNSVLNALINLLYSFELLIILFTSALKRLKPESIKNISFLPSGDTLSLTVIGEVFVTGSFSEVSFLDSVCSLAPSLLSCSVSSLVSSLACLLNLSSSLKFSISSSNLISSDFVSIVFVKSIGRYFFNTSLFSPDKEAISYSSFIIAFNLPNRADKKSSPFKPT